MSTFRVKISPALSLRRSVVILWPPEPIARHSSVDGQFREVDLEIQILMDGDAETSKNHMLLETG